LGLDINDIYQVLTYADDVNLKGEVIRTTERNAYVLLNSCNCRFSRKHRENYVYVRRLPGMIGKQAHPGKQ
jgi:hypothetical protein